MQQPRHGPLLDAAKDHPPCRLSCPGVPPVRRPGIRRWRAMWCGTIGCFPAYRVPPTANLLSPDPGEREHGRCVGDTDGMGEPARSNWRPPQCAFQVPLQRSHRWQREGQPCSILSDWTDGLPMAGTLHGHQSRHNPPDYPARPLRPPGGGAPPSGSRIPPPYARIAFHDSPSPVPGRGGACPLWPRMIRGRLQPAGSGERRSKTNKQGPAQLTEEQDRGSWPLHALWRPGPAESSR